MQDFLTLAVEAIATVSAIYFVAGFVAIAGRPVPVPTATQTGTDEVEATVEVCPTVEETLTNLSEANKTIDSWTEVEATSELNTAELNYEAIATTTELTVSLLQVEELQTPSFQDAIVPFKRPLTQLTIRQLKKRAKTACIPRYSRMRKPQLIAALQAL
jgi:Rho termination factor, N-terminal domain